MEVLDIQVEGRASYTHPWQELQVLPIGDVQLGVGGSVGSLRKLRRTIEWALAQEAAGGPPVRFLGMGDYIDLLSPSNRAAWRSTSLYDAAKTALADKAAAYVADFLHLVRGTEGKWLGLLHGHHFFEFEDGTTSDTRLAQALGTKYLGTCAYVRLRFVQAARHLTCTIWCHHGAGSGISPASPINKLLPIVNTFEADVYLIGHQTKKPVAKFPRIYMSDKPPYKLVAKNRVLAGTGGWSEGYELGSQHYSGSRPEGSYVERGMLAPVALGGILLKIRPVFGGKNTLDRLDLSVEV